MLHELLMQFLAAAVTLVVAFFLFLVSATFVRIVVGMEVCRVLRGLRDRVAILFHGPDYGSRLEHWRHYQDTVDSSMGEAACAAFHRSRASRARSDAWRRFHETVGRMFERGSLDDPVAQEAKVFAAYTTPDLIRVAKHLSGCVARGAPSPKPFLDFLIEERAEALRDPETFRDHARRFRDRFGFCPFRLLKYLDEDERAPS